MKTFGLFALIASSSSVVDGFSTTPSPLHHQASNAVPISSTSLRVIHHHNTHSTHLMRHHHHHTVEREQAQEQALSSTLPSDPSTTEPPYLPPFSETKAELRLDGLEPYVVVSAITSTTSFGVVTGGNLFSGSEIFASSQSIFQEMLRTLLLINSTASSALGLYALGIFSFSIMYSKAALSREDEAHQLYQTFFSETASFRLKGYRAFVLSLILLVADLFLFALAYLPETIQPIAALGSAPLLYTCWKDWSAIISKASVIYEPAPQQMETAAEVVPEKVTTPTVAAKKEAERMEQNGSVTLTLDKAIGVFTSLLM